MPLITIRDLSIGFRGPPLLDAVTFSIEPGQRIGLLGRNGSGKTTLMKMLCGVVQPDGGEITFAPGARVSLLPQDVPQEIHGTITEVVAGGLAIPFDDLEHGWESEQSVEQILSRMDLSPTARFESLSSGMKRRVLLARALVSKPDLLLLDEPTNHLDLEAIDWLETFLSRWNTTLLFVTHDRMFLRKLATRILELDRGRLFDWSCDYDGFLKRKEEALASEEKNNTLFDKKLAIEEVWIRTGVKARRTRNEGRVRALEQMRLKRQDRRKTVGKVRLEIQEGERSGNLVVDVEEVSFSHGPDKPILKDFSTTIMRGDKVGIIGPNGSGKTTLLRILLGQLTPQTGNVKLGTNLQIAYFDQLRQQLDEEQTIQHNVGDGYSHVTIGGEKTHVIGYLQDFLFSPERSRSLVRFLSGGERNRVLLAKLFAKPANIIVLDEPTNDLDAETLELLEERLVQFAGTVLLVSHDRAFLNNVVTSTIVFEEDGLREYVGGYDDWQRQRLRRQEEAAANLQSARRPTTGDTAVKTKKRILSYKEQQELAGLPAKIEKLESAIATLHETIAQPDFYRQPKEAIAKEQKKLSDLEAQLRTIFTRWEELEAQAS